MSDRIQIRKAEGTWVVRAGGAVLGESDAALELTEQGHDPVIFFPRGDIAMAFLEPTDQKSASPAKGVAREYSIVTKSTTLQNAAFGYEDPAEATARLKDHIAFRISDTVTVERL
jgi:uncharacterized protein (DUF427 family)